MLAYIYATGLFLYSLFRKSNSKVNSDSESLIERVNILERGFVFLDRDINNGLMGGTSISSNNRIIDGKSNPAIESRTVLRGFIGNNSDVWFQVQRIPSHLSVNWNFSDAHASNLSLDYRPKFVHRIKSTNWRKFESYSYNKLYKTEVFEALYNNREHPKDGSPIEREGCYRCDTFWRFDQLIISRPKVSSKLLCFMAYMKHNIDYLDRPVTSLSIGSEIIALKLDRERSNVLVVTNTSCVITEAYLLCDFYTTELDATQFKRADSYSYLEISLDGIKSRIGSAYAIIRLKCDTISKVFHQLGGI